MVRTRNNGCVSVWNDFSRMQDEVQKLFNGDTAAPAALPVTAWADENNFYLEADLPGFAPADVDVRLTDGNTVILKAERTLTPPDGGTWLRQERPSGPTARTLTLPVLVDADRVTAAFANGVLTVTLPKSEAAKPRKIEVK